MLNLLEQRSLNFGRHRSGLKYGLDYLAPLHDSYGITFDAFLERTFCWHPEGPRSHKQPWIGMVHVPPNMPPWFHPEQSHKVLFRSRFWDESRQYCLGLFAFSDYHREFLEKSLGVSVDSLVLPTEIPRKKWSMRNFEANRSRKVVQIGWWLRKLHAIYQLCAPGYTRVFLDAGHQSVKKLMAKEREIFAKEWGSPEQMSQGVEIMEFLSNREYDQLLAENIAFLSLYDASANNAIVECIARTTPVLVNPLPAIQEYLGKDYPFYFTSLAEATDKLVNMDLIHKTHEYLVNLPIRRRLSGAFFLRSVAESNIYRGLPPPQPKL